MYLCVFYCINKQACECDVSREDACLRSVELQIKLQQLVTVATQMWNLPLRTHRSDSGMNLCTTRSVVWFLGNPPATLPPRGSVAVGK